MRIPAGRLFLLTASLTILSACADMPAGAPSAAQITKGATEEDATFAVYPVTRDTLPMLKTWPRKGQPPVSGWISRTKVPSSQIVEPGDTIIVGVNGKAGDDSRSVNDAYIQPQFNYRFDGGSTLTFAPKVKAYFGVASENSDYADYAGRVDWNLRWAQDNGAVVSAMYRQGDQRRRTTQLDFAWSLQRTWLNMNGYLHLQYFNGYGETLLGYNQRNESQFRIGVSIVP